MSLPNYQITVIDPTTGQTLKIYEAAAFYDLRFERALNGVGALVMTLPATDDVSSVFVLDALVVIARTSPVSGALQTEDTYLTRYTQRVRVGNDERFAVGGLSLNHLLQRRVVDPADDPLAAGGYSTKAGPSDTIMRAYAREQMGDLASTARQVPNFTVGEVLTVGTPIGKRLRYENLLTVMQDMANQGAMDFLIHWITNNTLRLTIEPIGTDKTRSRNYPFGPFVQLDPLRGNLTSPSLTIDRKKEGNYCYALGQGPGEQRTVLQLGGNGQADSPYNRMEFMQDARSAERGNSLALLTSARDALRTNQPKREFSFTPTGQEPGNTYRLDWDLGDRITAVWGDQWVDLRIRNVEIRLTSVGLGEEITVKVEPI